MWPGLDSSMRKGTTHWLVSWQQTLDRTQLGTENSRRNVPGDGHFLLHVLNARSHTPLPRLHRPSPTEKGLRKDSNRLDSLRQQRISAHSHNQPCLMVCCRVTGLRIHVCDSTQLAILSNCATPGRVCWLRFANWCDGSPPQKFPTMSRNAERGTVRWMTSNKRPC